MRAFESPNWALWILTLAHLIFTILAVAFAWQLNQSESQQRGIFSVESNVKDILRRLTGPIGGIGGGITQVVPVATQVVSGAASLVNEVTSSIAAVETMVAGLMDFGFEVGTKDGSLLLPNEKPIAILPADVDLQIPSVLQPVLGETISDIRKQFKLVSSISLSDIAFAGIAFEGVSACIYGYAAIMFSSRARVKKPASRPGRRRALPANQSRKAVLIVGTITSFLACLVFGGIYGCMRMILSIARNKITNIEAGWAVKHIALSFTMSVVQLCVSIVLNLILRKSVVDDTQHGNPGLTQSDYSEEAPSSETETSSLPQPTHKPGGPKPMHTSRFRETLESDDGGDKSFANPISASN